MSLNKKSDKSPTKTRIRGASASAIHENYKCQQVNTKNFHTSFALKNVSQEKETSGVRYITEDLIKRTTKKSCLSEIISLNLTLNKEGARKIQFIENLDKLTNLTTLNLSCNRIEKIENLDNLTNLKELNLSFNNIVKLDGLQNLSQLQNLILNGNSIANIPAWFPQKLKLLRILRLTKNRLVSLSEITQLKILSDLTVLTVNENPLCELPHFRIYIIFHLRTLRMLDGLTVSSKELADADKRFSQDERTMVEESLKKITFAYNSLKEESEKINQEKNSLKQQIQNLLRKESSFHTLQESLENQLKAKTELLQTKTMELTSAYEKYYQLEQELAFFKIDCKFDSFSKSRSLSNNLKSVQSSKEVIAVSTDIQEKLHESLNKELIDKKKQVDRAKERLNILQKDLTVSEEQLDSVLKILSHATNSKLLRLTNNDDENYLKSELKLKMDNVTKLKLDIDNMEKEIQGKEDKIYQQEEELQKWKDKLVVVESATHSDSKSIHKVIEQKELHLHLSRKLLNIHQQKLENLIDSLASETRNIKKIEELLTQGETFESKEMIFELKQIISQMDNYLSHKKQLNSLLEKDYKLMKDEYTRLEEDHTKLKSEYTKLQNSHTKLEEEYKNVKKELEQQEQKTKLVNSCACQVKNKHSLSSNSTHNISSSSNDSISSQDIKTLHQIHHDLSSIQKQVQPLLNQENNKPASRTLSEGLLHSTPKLSKIQEISEGSQKFSSKSQILFTNPLSSFSCNEFSNGNLIRGSFSEISNCLELHNSSVIKYCSPIHQNHQILQTSEVVDETKIRCSRCLKAASTDFINKWQCSHCYDEEVMKKGELQSINTLISVKKLKLGNLQKLIQNLSTECTHMKVEVEAVKKDHNKEQEHLQETKHLITETKNDLTTLKAELGLLQEEKQQQEKYLSDINQELALKGEELKTYEVQIKIALELLGDIESAKSSSKKESNIKLDSSEKQKVDVPRQQSFTDSLEVASIDLSIMAQKNYVAALNEKKCQLEAIIMTARDHLFHIISVVNDLKSKKEYLLQQCNILDTKLHDTQVHLSIISPEKTFSLGNLPLESSNVTDDKLKQRSCESFQNIQSSSLPPNCSTHRTKPLLFNEDYIFNKENFPTDYLDRLDYTPIQKHLEEKKSRDVNVFRTLKKRLSNLEMVLFMFNKSEVSVSLSGASSNISQEANVRLIEDPVSSKDSD